MRSLLASKQRTGRGSGMGGGGAVPALPGISSQTLFAGYDGSLPASQSYSRLSNGWNSETGAVSPHNLILQSNVFDTTWSNVAASSTLAAGVTTPDGYPAWSLTEDGANTNHRNAQSVVTVSGDVWFTVEAKASTRTEIQLYAGIVPLAKGFNLATGAVFANSIGVTDADYVMIPLGDGWYLCAIKYQATGGNATNRVYLSSGGVHSYQGNGTSRVYYAKSRLNNYAPTDYVPTTTAAVYMPRYQTGRQGQGILIEGASTNKCTAWSVPKDTDAVGVKLTGSGSFNNMTLSGDAASTLSVALDTIAIDNAIALNPTDGSMVALRAAEANGYKVYKLDNSGASISSIVTVSGAAGNLNTHNMSINARVSSTILGANIRQQPTLEGQTNINTSMEYVRYKTPAFTGTVIGSLGIAAQAGQVVYFLLPQLEESAYATSPILCQGIATTRAKSDLTFNPTSILTPTQGTIMGWVYVAENGAWRDTSSSAYLFGTSTSGDANRIHILKTLGNIDAAIYTSAGVVGVALSAAGTLSVGWHHIALTYQAGTDGAVLYIDGVSADTYTPTGLATAVGTVAYVGAKHDGTLQAQAKIDNFHILTVVLTSQEIKTYYLRGK